WSGRAVAQPASALLCRWCQGQQCRPTGRARSASTRSGRLRATAAGGRVMSRKTANTGEAAVLAATPSAMTTPAQLERLGEHLRKLRLLKSGERLEAMLQYAAAQELPYAEFLEKVLGEEVAAKTSKNIAMRTAMARLPFVKPLETFEFGYQPSIDRKQLQTLA